MITKFLKWRIICSRKISVFMSKSSAYLSAQPFSASAPSLRLLWRRHCSSLWHHNAGLVQSRANTMSKFRKSAIKIVHIISNFSLFVLANKLPPPTDLESSLTLMQSQGRSHNGIFVGQAKIWGQWILFFIFFLISFFFLYFFLFLKIKKGLRCEMPLFSSGFEVISAK